VKKAAENTHDDFMPTPSRITCFVVPSGKDIRVDTHCYPGYTICSFYDSLMAKLIVKGETRDLALENLRATLSVLKSPVLKRTFLSVSSL
jgi:acetyl-CoA carboxylase, biotin carboxylase subunit